MKLSLALDLPSAKQNIELVDLLDGLEFSAKININSFLDGTYLLTELQKRNIEVCVDLNLIDIPSVMAKTATKLANLNVEMFTISMMAGDHAIDQVVNAVDKCYFRPKIITSTVLTSLNEDMCYKIFGMDIQDKVESFVADSVRAGCDGIMCSVHEAGNLKPLIKDKIICCPGIRWGDQLDDQIRSASIELAKANGVDYIVVGRPIYQSKDPRTTVENIIKKMLFRS